MSGRGLALRIAPLLACELLVLYDTVALIRTAMLLALACAFVAAVRHRHVGL